VGGSASPVDHREHLAGGEPAERQQRYRHPNAGGEEHVAGRVDAERDAGEPDQRHQPGRQPLAHVAPAALRHQRVQDPDQQGRQVGDVD
jgi:hypothetical protein